MFKLFGMTVWWFLFAEYPLNEQDTVLKPGWYNVETTEHAVDTMGDEPVVIMDTSSVASKCYTARTSPSKRLYRDQIWAMAFGFSLSDYEVSQRSFSNHRDQVQFTDPVLTLQLIYEYSPNKDGMAMIVNVKQNSEYIKGFGTKRIDTSWISAECLETTSPDPS